MERKAARSDLFSSPFSIKDRYGAKRSSRQVSYLESIESFGCGDPLNLRPDRHLKLFRLHQTRDLGMQIDGLPWGRN